MSLLDTVNHPAHADHDPAKDVHWNQLDSKTQARVARDKALKLINQAQSLLYEAAQTACPLQGWVKPWEQIGDHADATKALWHQVNNAPMPTGHDSF